MTKNNEEIVEQQEQSVEQKPEKSLEIQKYEIDKKFELQQEKLKEASSIIVGNSNLTAISMMAEKFARAGNLIPKEFQGQPEKCFAAIYKGASIGLDAFTSLQRIAVVNGRATIWGDAALAVVRNTGELEFFREYFGVWVSRAELTQEELSAPENQEMIKKFNGIIRKSALLDSANEKCGAACELKRKNGDLVFQFFTILDAKNAGLWGADVWKKYPQRMIAYRARAYALRDSFPDVLEGLYVKEEMEGLESFSSEKIVSTPKITEEQSAELNEKQKEFFNQKQ